jgi:hypothetical protein
MQTILPNPLNARRQPGVCIDVRLRLAPFALLVFTALLTITWQPTQLPNGSYGSGLRRGVRFAEVTDRPDDGLPHLVPPQTIAAQLALAQPSLPGIVLRTRQHGTVRMPFHPLKIPPPTDDSVSSALIS